MGSGEVLMASKLGKLKACAGCKRQAPQIQIDYVLKKPRAQVLGCQNAFQLCSELHLETGCHINLRKPEPMSADRRQPEKLITGLRNHSAPVRVGKTLARSLRLTSGLFGLHITRHSIFSDLCLRSISTVGDVCTGAS